MNNSYKPKANIDRANVPDKYKWNSEDIFKSDNLHSVLNLIESNTKKINTYNRKLDDQNLLSDALKLSFETRLLTEKCVQYTKIRYDQDKSNTKNLEEYQNALQHSKHYQTSSTFITNYLISLDDEKFPKLLENKSLSTFEYYLKDLRRRKQHRLSDESEIILSSFGDNLSSNVDMPHESELVFSAITQDIKFPIIKDENDNDIQLTTANYPIYKASPNRNVRKNAYQSFLNTMSNFENTFAANLTANIKFNSTAAKLRGYNNTLDGFMDESNMDPKVYHNLIDTVSKNISILHDHVNLIGEAINDSNIHMYDISAPISDTTQLDISYEEAIEDVKIALKPLGEIYLSKLLEGLKVGSGWVDVFPNKNKSGGAYSYKVYSVHPFVKLNFMNKIDNVFTFAHEFGHAIHSTLNHEANDYHDSGYVIFSAEIASTLNEMLLHDYLMKKYEDNKQVQLYLLGSQLSRMRALLFRQTQFAEFELAAYNQLESGNQISSNFLNELYANLLRKYYGERVLIEECDKREWSIIPHFYYNFYVYTYATGICCSIALSQMFLNGGNSEIEKYLNFLRQPIYKSPIEILKTAGVDITKSEPIESAINFYKKIINKTRNLITNTK